MRIKYYGLPLVVALTTLFLAACSSTNIVSTSDPDADFSKYKTFSFVKVPDTDGKQYESMETGYLKTAVMQEMQSRGLQLSETPDVLINFSLETQEKIRTRSVPTSNYGGGYYDPYYGAYNDGWGGSHETRIDQYTEGKLNIDLIDPELRKVVWQGSTQGRLTTKMMENARSTLNIAVEEVYSQFPIDKAATP